MDEIDITASRTSITINPTRAGDQYIVVPKGTTPSEEDWAEIGKLSLNGEELVFDNLTPGTEYDVISRTPEDETHNASEPSDPVTVKTLDHQWSLCDVILAILTVIQTITMLLTISKKSEDGKEKKLSKLLGIIPALAAVITVILTQDLRAPMGIFDKWTWLMALYLVVNTVILAVTRHKNTSNTEL